MLKQAYAAY